jgi:hypothetical protein
MIVEPMTASAKAAHTAMRPAADDTRIGLSSLNLRWGGVTAVALARLRAVYKGPVARMERSEMRERYMPVSPDFASLNPGYACYPALRTP